MGSKNALWGVVFVGVAVVVTFLLIQAQRAGPVQDETEAWRLTAPKLEEPRLVEEPPVQVVEPAAEERVEVEASAVAAPDPESELPDGQTEIRGRFVFEDGSWGLLRASSNQPCLVIVAESRKSDQHMRAIVEEIQARLEKTGRIGKYDQQLPPAKT